MTELYCASKKLDMNDEVLNSWKEIAAYLGRGVRTVQRWEQELGLPVRRPRGKDRSAVIALKPDLDQWLHRMPQATATDQPKGCIDHLQLRRNAELLKLRAAEAMALSQKLQARMAENLALAAALNLKRPARREQVDHKSAGIAAVSSGHLVQTNGKAASQ